MKFNKAVLLLTGVVAILSMMSIILVIIAYPVPYTEITTLEKQYIGNASGSGGRGENCLIMEVDEVYIDHPDAVYPIKDHAIYYFAGEHEIRDDLHPGDIINVRWKYILFEGYRIRGVSLRHM